MARGFFLLKKDTGHDQSHIYKAMIKFDVISEPIVCDDFNQILNLIAAIKVALMQCIECKSH